MAKWSKQIAIIITKNPTNEDTKVKTIPCDSQAEFERDFGKVNMNECIAWATTNNYLGFLSILTGGN